MEASTVKRETGHRYPNVAELCLQVKHLAQTYGPDAKLPTIPELCTLLGTSHATMDKVFSQLEEQDVLYRRQGQGIFVSPRLFCKNICIIFDSDPLLAHNTSPFWALLWAQFALQAQQRAALYNEHHSLHIVLRTSDQSIPLPKEVIRMIEAQQVHGVLGISVDEVGGKWIMKHNVPYVAFATYGDLGVGLDSTEFVRMAVEKMVEQGCKHISLWTYTPTGDMTELITLFRALVLAHGLPFHPHFVQSLAPTTPSLTRQEQGYRIAKAMYRGTTALRSDGVIIMDDQMTEGALDVFLTSDIRLGRDLMLVTHANTGSMHLFNHIPGTTVLEFDPAEIVQNMFSALEILMAGQKPPPHLACVPPRFRTISPG